MLTAATFAFSGLANGQTVTISDFQVKVDCFLKKYSADFVVSKDNLDGTGQQFTLDTKTKPTWTMKVTLKSKAPLDENYNQTVYQRLYFAFYKFDNEKQCTEALDSLLNCFGGDCGKIKWNVSGQSSKTIPCVYLINETEIISCHINCSTQNDFWTKFKHDFKMTFGNSVTAIMETGCGGPIEFKKF